MSLDEFIRKAQSKPGQRDFDPKLRLKKWLQELDDLFNAIEAALMLSFCRSRKT